MLTVSFFKFDARSVAGANSLAASLRNTLEGAGNVMSFHAVESGNSVLLLLSHSEGAKSDVILELVKNAVKSAEAVAAELEFDALENESLIAVLYGKDAKSFNTALYNVYANPVNTPGLALDGGMHAGFKFEVYASSRNDRIILDSPEEAYDLVSLVGYGGCVVNRVFKKAGEHAASASYSGNGQILLARCGSGFPQADDFSKALGKAKLKAFYFSVKGGLISVEKKPDGTERPNEVSPGILARLKPRFSRIL